MRRVKAMKNGEERTPRPGRQRYLVAMVLGTALTALGSTSAARADVPDATQRAVGDISRYCSACWRNARLPADSWTDCTQEVFSRLLERVDPDAWARVLRDEGEERREFLRAIDAVKKRTQRSRKWVPGMVELAADRRDADERRLADDRETVRAAAAEVLTPRQQQVLQLSLEGWSVHDIAAELNTPAARVSDEKYKAIRKLRDHLARAEG
jgi:RNA polymerase sigma factor (sigma-70 family)